MALIWQTQEAKAKFSQLVKAALEQGDQPIACRGEVVVVLISKEKYDELTRPKTSLIAFFKNAPCPEIELDTERNKELPREIVL